jgi:iron complex transport system permease protein
MENRKRILLLIGAVVVLIAIFLFYNMGSNFGYVFERRGIKIATILIVSFCVAYSAVIFQTLTANKILTPSIMGFEAVYLLFQTVIVFIHGDKTFKVLSQSNNFFISIGLMMLFALLMYVLIFRKGSQNMFYLLLIGLVLGTLFTTLSSFMQLIIDPNEFSIIEGMMFATFNKINVDLLWIASGIVLLVFLIGYYFVKFLDVIALGKNNAINLGVNYKQVVQLFLLLIAILVAVSTALVGPITFLGILVTNLTYELFRTHKHTTLIVGCWLVSCIFLIGGQFLVEHLFNFSTTISIIINFIGGIYFLFLLMRTQKA